MAKYLYSRGIKVDRFVAEKCIRTITTSCAPCQKRNVKQKTDREDLEKENVRPLSDLPGPKGLPLVGTMLHVYFGSGGPFTQTNFHEYGCRRHERYGPMFKETIGPVNIVWLADPQAIKELVRQEGPYPERPEVAPWRYYWNTRNIIGLFGETGEAWMKHRQPLNRYMLRPRNVAAYTADLNEVLVDFFIRLENLLQRDDYVDQIQKLLYKWSMESSCYIMFERRLGVLEPSPPPDVLAFIQAHNDVLEATEATRRVPLKLLTTFKPPMWKQFLSSMDTMHETGLKHITERIELVEQKLSEGEELPGLTAALVSGGQLSKRDIYGSLMTLMSASVDTSSSTALWCLYLLAKNPDKQSKLLKELKQIMPPDGVPTENAVKEMHYIKAVIRETLRLYPTAPFLGRIAQDDIILKGYLIPKGTFLTIHLWYMGRDPKLYRDPDVFRPERWLRGHPDSGEFDPFSSLPFGFGGRGCVGRRLAELKLQLLISRLLYRYEIGLVEPNKEIRTEMKILLIPKDPIRITLAARN